MKLAELLTQLSAAATPGSWNPKPKRLTIPLEGGEVAQGPLMSYLVGAPHTGPGMTVSLGSERVADHQFVAALVNAFRDGDLVVREQSYVNSGADAARYRWLNKQHNFLVYIENDKGERQQLRLRCGLPLDEWIDNRLKDERECEGESK
jgi:hypothetical protein